MYISNGTLRKRRPCGLWIIPALLWSILNLFGLFFKTMCDDSKKKRPRITQRPSTPPRRPPSVRSFRADECQTSS